MSFFNKLGGVLGATKELDVEEYMNSEEMENVDVLNEPADFYIKPVSLQQESDVQLIQNELQRRNIILLNITEMQKRPNTLKGVIDSLKSFVDKTNGDIARIDNDKILLTPAKVKIIKRKTPAQKK
ncbi:MAG: cell division protein SepF [Candidatus Marsarchaeota archaeon]|nr:cell division protein SepF [Candidatus Marsarchaeota archaeon]